MIVTTTHIDIAASEATVSEISDIMLKLRHQYPEQEIIFDGDLYAIVGREQVE